VPLASRNVHDCPASQVVTSPKIPLDIDADMPLTDETKHGTLAMHKRNGVDVRPSRHEAAESIHDRVDMSTEMAAD